jgi:hypothetical protein
MKVIEPKLSIELVILFSAEIRASLDGFAPSEKLSEGGDFFLRTEIRREILHFWRLNLAKSIGE